MKTYPLTYTLQTHDPPIAKDALVPEQGAADDLLVISVVHGADEEQSYAFASICGASKQPLDPNELFKAWVVFGIMMGDLFDAADPRQLIPRGVLAEVKQLAGLAEQLEEAATDRSN